MKNLFIILTIPFLLLGCMNEDDTTCINITDEGYLNGPEFYHKCDCECGLTYNVPIDQHILNNEKCINCEGICLVENVENVTELLEKLSKVEVTNQN